jgi:parvulin-like peptidyl-prolyl isomerase
VRYVVASVIVRGSLLGLYAEEPRMHLISRVLREPLVHFIAAGAILFGAYVWLNPAEEPSTLPKVHISEGDVQSLQEIWRLQWQREPTAEELNGAVMQLLNERLLAAEAREMRLDENDIIVRRRLSQKLNFIIEGTAHVAEASERDLQDFYASHAAQFRNEVRISFTQVYFSPARRADVEADARAGLAKLVAQGMSEPDGTMGDSFLLGSDFDQTEQVVSNAFGQDFAHVVFALVPGTWNGPIRSGYGVHLVHISALQPSQLRPFAQVRSQVLEAWRGQQEKAIKEAYLARLRKKYDVVIEGQVKSLVGGL